MPLLLTDSEMTCSFVSQLHCSLTPNGQHVTLNYFGPLLEHVFKYADLY